MREQYIVENLKEAFDDGMGKIIIEILLRDVLDQSIILCSYELLWRCIFSPYPGPLKG